MVEEKKSPLLEDKIEIIDKPKYSDEEEQYLKGLRQRLEVARNERDREHKEFDGMDYVTYFNTMEEYANTFIQPKKNKEDSTFQSGTIRTKLLALLAPILNLDLRGDISAYDKNALKIQTLGDAMEDIRDKTNEIDNDDEKKLMRQYEMLKHGTVFVEEVWDERDQKIKQMQGKFNGKLNDVKWVTKIQKAFAKPSRNIIPGVNVYLGDITQYNITDQPYIFTVSNIPYQEAKMIFGDWDRWDNVPKKKTNFDSQPSGAFYDWRLLEVQDDYVEIVRYQDKWNNEFAVLLNGVLMTPVGLPLPWGYEGYNIAQQNLEPIHIKFAYGKSLVLKIKNKVAILDEMLRLSILKTQKSFMPPYVNISGRILSNKILMPGKISHGIAPNTLVPINDKEAQGITNAELAMISSIQDSINSETTSPTFQGQQTGGNPTATEIVELQRQSKQMLGLTIFSVSMLEWKLEWLRLQNLLAHWFEAEGQVVDEIRGVLKNKYRETSIDTPIENEGMGQRLIIPTDNMPEVEGVMKAEDILSKEKNMPVRLVFLSPQQITNAKLTWQIVITPKEKRSSEVDKLMFRAFMADAQIFGPKLNIDYLGEKFATTWNENPQKLFNQGQPIMPPQGQVPTNGSITPKQKIPTPETALNKDINSALGMTQ